MIPEEVKNKIREMFPIKQPDSSDHTYLDPIMKMNACNYERQVGAEFGYSLASEEIEKKDEEIKKLKDTIEKLGEIIVHLK